MTSARALRMAVAIMTTLVAASSLETKAETAASIDYKVVERPAAVPAEFAAPDGIGLRFLAIKTIDGFNVDAALWQPEGKAASATTLVIGVHGSGDNFVKPPMGFMGRALAGKGYGVLAINTRQNGERVNTDNSWRCGATSRLRSTPRVRSATAASCSTATASATSRCSITPPTIGSRTLRPC